MSETTFNSLLDLRRRFLGFVQRRVNDRAAAEDILQNAYIRALDREGQLRESDSAVAWFYRILRNAIIDHYRRRTTEEAALDRWAEQLQTETGVDPMLFEATCQCIGGALEILTPAYAEFLREVDLGETSVADYAKAHNISPGNAAVRAHRARAALRKQLIRCCGTCSTHGCLECSCLAKAASQPAAGGLELNKT
jgi:RNA polymerase sigma factor (sigma-70 family)